MQRMPKSSGICKESSANHPIIIKGKSIGQIWGTKKIPGNLEISSWITSSCQSQRNTCG